MAKITFTSTGGITADSTITAPDFNGLASSSNFLKCNDTRNVNPLPTSINTGISLDFKSNSIVGISGHNDYSGVLTFRSYGGSGSDYSGGPAHRLAFVQDGVILHQTGSGSSWSSWEQMMSSAGGTFTGSITAPSVYGAVFNDLADSIEVEDGADLEYGYCYVFDGKSHHKSTKYLDDGILGIHSDTYGFKMGVKEKKTLDLAVSGFVLAYVDKEYPSGTPLTAGENGILTKIDKQDKIENPEKIIGTFYKVEPNEIWGTEDRKIQVNGRHWVKIK